MKKTCIVIAITILASGILFASQSWIGLQGTGSYKQETTTYTFLSITAEEEHTAMLAGLNVAGTIYPGKAPIGVGFQVGFAKTINATRGGNNQDVADLPLTWNGGVTGKFGLAISEMLSLEIGAGLGFQSVTQIFDIGGSNDVEATLNTLNAIAVADVVLHLTETIAVVGKMGASLPLSTQATFTLGSTSYDHEFDVAGFAINGQIGIALSL